MAHKILIVDDEEFFIKPIKLLLDRSGYETFIAHDGMSGLSLARSAKPDLIMLDLMLPGMDGYQVCRLLKFDEDFKNIPVIIVSAKDTEQDRALGRKSGADHYMVKPINPNDLLITFKSILSQV